MHSRFSSFTSCSVNERPVGLTNKRVVWIYQRVYRFCGHFRDSPSSYSTARRPLYGSGTLTLWRRRRCRIQEASSPGKDICPCQSERLPSRLRLFPHDSFLSTVSRLVPIQYNFVVYTRAVACSFNARLQLSFSTISFSRSTIIKPDKWNLYISRGDLSMA